VNYITEDILMHYGMPRRSGRYPWGSGENAYQHSRDFLGRIEELKKSGWEETPENIMEEFGLTTTQYRTEKSLAKNERRAYQVATAKTMTEDGFGPTEIGRRLGVNESTVRSLLNDKSEDRMNEAKNAAEFLKARMKEIEAERGMLDVGVGAERELRISKEKMKEALYMLEREGYGVYSGRMPQPTNPGQFTTQTVLCPPDIKPAPGKQAPADIYDLARIHSIKEYISRDGGETFEKKFYYPASLDSKRVKILLKDEVGPDGYTGDDKDGLIQIRRGVPDLSLGESRYSQVRILVDGNKYLKGMAVYSDNLPDGVDVLFNSNKTKPEDAYKKIKDDPDNPFGSLIKDAEQGGQYWYDADTGKRCSANDPNVKNKKLGLINKRADEGDWEEWANALPSQFLAKQNMSLITKQLDLAKTEKMAEFDDIMALDNPTIKKHYLDKFADECDSTAVHLQAAALPGQKYHVIVPVNTLKDNEVYAPGYPPGSQLALVRYPHGGTFEIPKLTVVDKNPVARDTIGTLAGDAICINKKVADKLSGADFDGDTVMCIPTDDKHGRVRITTKNTLEGLVGFNPKDKYQYDSHYTDDDGVEHYSKNGKEFRVMKSTGLQMGMISNLITDMTLAGATEDELSRAVRHSMVVIDAEKHKLDYRQSEIDNNIDALKAKYQRSIDADGNEHIGGASTILSRAKGEVSVDKRQGTPKANIKGTVDYDPSRPEGALIYKTNADLYYPIRKYDKNTGEMTLTTSAGKKIKYNVNNPTDVDYYTPIKKVDADGNVSYTNKTGEISYKFDKKKEPSTRMAGTDDAYTLVNDPHNAKERAYADYANYMKDLANKARVELANTGNLKANAQAKAEYSAEVQSLNTKLNTALMNATREREAMRRANVEVAEKKKKYEEENGVKMKPGDVKKLNQQAMTKYRKAVASVSRRDRNITITDREWEAIQKGAISENILKQILNNADPDKLRERATPRVTTEISQYKVDRIKRMSSSNYTIAQIAAQLGVSTSTVSKYLKGD
jgi:DNA-binding CsgD family transcriptional regulator